MQGSDRALRLVGGDAAGPVLSTGEGLSFWGGVAPESGEVIDVHHPLAGQLLTGAVLVMPTSRGSCTGSGVLLDLILNGKGPVALVFREAEDVLTLGALVAAELFGKSLPVLRLGPALFARAQSARQITVSGDAVAIDEVTIPFETDAATALFLTPADCAMLAGEGGDAVAIAMRILCAMAAQQGARGLTDISRAHIDGCIYASRAHLTFAEAMADRGARVRVPTTTNAISVDHENWRAQGVPEGFGGPAARLAEAYVRMGAEASFTCAPYLLADPPRLGEALAWSESNAVIFANTVLGARTAKLPDFLDLCAAITGRVPLAGVYEAQNRRARRIIRVETPLRCDDAFWPVLGYLVGQSAPDRIPLVVGLESATPSADDLKAMCAAFGTTSGAAMLHLAGTTPEAGSAIADGADEVALTAGDFHRAWLGLSAGEERVDLVAIGSPHASVTECRALAAGLAGRVRHAETDVIVTVGRDVMAALRQDGTLAGLQSSGVRIVPDLCWCSISEPVFPPAARVVLTNSGKYAHYGPGLSGRAVRLGSLADCVDAAVTGRSSVRQPGWFA
jgi:cis-L-3-hydroxyproline dehydratase